MSVPRGAVPVRPRTKRTVVDVRPPPEELLEEDSKAVRHVRMPWLLVVVLVWLIALSLGFLLLVLWSTEPAAPPTARTTGWRHVRFNTSVSAHFDIYAPGMQYDRVWRYELCCRDADSMICGVQRGLHCRLLRPQLVRVDVTQGAVPGECFFYWLER